MKELQKSNTCLPQLPKEVLLLTLEFCHGKTLSTILLASFGCSDLIPNLWNKVIDIVTGRLTDMAQRIQIHESIQKDLKGASEWILAIIQIPQIDWNTNLMNKKTYLDTIRYNIRFLSENLAVLDYLYESLTLYSNESSGHFEWPIWCGQLTIESFPSESRIRSNTRVIITHPMQRPCFIPSGSNLMKNHVPCSVFRCEPYNVMIPVPPWGKIRGLTPQDTAILLPVAKRLDDLYQVAIPAGFYSYNILDVRIVTKKRVQQSWQSLRRPGTSWFIQDDLESSPLVCFWEDDSSDLKDDREYITYIIDFLKARDRLYQSQEPSERKMY